ncbi:MAG: M13 family metallopeptidase, partial [Odoribacteraceae bacterium]|nr:M13 family metallopeptidase [Odoribacteraceae bacterium]
MKKGLYISCLVAAVMLGGCNEKKTVLTSGIDPSNLDPTALPGTDFYRYACGGWIDKHPLGGEYASFGSFDMLDEENLERLEALIKDAAGSGAPEGSDERKIGDLYAVAMDSVKLNAEGGTPVRHWLERIAATNGKEERLALVALMQRSGFGPYFSVYVDADPGDSRMNIVHAGQGGLSLGEREYYLDQDEYTRGIREAFRAHVAGVFELAGFSREEAIGAVARVMEVEMRLATAARGAVELRDPRANYNKMTVEELQQLAPGIDWNAYFDALGLPGLRELNVGQVEALHEAAAILNETPAGVQRSYLQWKVLSSASAYLSDDFQALNFDFYGKTLSGQQEPRPRWKRAVATIDGVLGERVGKLYVEKHFPAAAKERMIALVEHLRVALGERIRGLAWMSDETRERALEKLDVMIVKVGYPDAWRDYSALEIKGDSYWANIERASHFMHDYMLSKAGKPVDRSEWMMTPQTVNAYYNPVNNEICFPAAILQYPFFDMRADDAFNYGAIGGVIGHEMTHGFDDEGRQFDKEGNLRDWWTPEDAARFEARARVLVEHFNAIEVLPGLNANGKLTLGENIADLGGIGVAYA